MPTGPQPQNVLPVTTGHTRPRVLSPGACRPSQRVTYCPRGLSHSAFRPSQRVTHAHGAPPPTRAARHNGSQMTTGPQHQRFRPVTTQGYTRTRGPVPKRSARHNGSQTPTGPQPQRVPLVRMGLKSLRAPVPKRSARHNGSQMPTGPTPQRVLPVTTGHKRPRGPTLRAFRSSERSMRAHGA